MSAAVVLFSQLHIPVRRAPHSFGSFLDTLLPSAPSATALPSPHVVTPALLLCPCTFSCPRHALLFWRPCWPFFQAQLQCCSLSGALISPARCFAQSCPACLLPQGCSSGGLLGEDSTRCNHLRDDRPRPKTEEVLHVTLQEFYITQSFWKLPTESKLPSNRVTPFV